LTHVLANVAAIVTLTLPGELISAEVVTVAGTGKKESSGGGGLARDAGAGEPYGLTIGPDGALYFCDIAFHVIRRVDKAGRISTAAGSGKKGYAGDGGPATQALLNEPYEIKFDADGAMYFVEMQNNVVRKVDPTSGTISTVAGTGKPGFSGDGGSAREATFNKPHSIALDGKGSLLICDIGNHRVRRVDLKSAVVTTFTGNGEKSVPKEGSPFVNAAVSGPRAIDFTMSGDAILALREGNSVFRLDLAKQQFVHLAGTGKQGYTGDGGAARSATLSGPKGVAIAPNGDIFLADTESHTVRVLRHANGIIETVVGDGKKHDGPDGDPKSCGLARPHGVCVDAAGNVFIGDSENYRVRKWTVRPPNTTSK
jgi:DNA-binding beta-propeller fold protein YncE